MTAHPPTSALLAHSTRFWDKTARKYAASPIADMAGYEHTLQRVRQRLRPTDRVLELGSGTATTALRLAAATGHYTAADLSPAMVDIARQKLKEAPPDVQQKLHLIVTDADAHLPAPAPADGYGMDQTKTAEGWDTVLAFNLLHLVPDLGHTLAQVVRHLRPGGLFISKTACIAHMNPLVPHVALPVLRLLKVIPPIHVLNEDQLLTAIERSGLIIDSVEHHATPQRSRDWRPYVVARKPEA
ncbi:MAG TPA: class I SAM-dependent methyltransferase [Burkholderiaceae bacterium]|nr:class I SAM-dependent methyltransferase [Burkholderiaceae bacterium]